MLLGLTEQWLKVKDFSKEELTTLEYKVLRAQKSSSLMPIKKLIVLLLVKTWKENVVWMRNRKSYKLDVSIWYLV